MKQTDRLKNVIIYGLGKDYETQKLYLRQKFCITGYSDKKLFQMEQYIKPCEISRYHYDHIYITSAVHYEEIRKELVSVYHVDAAKILSREAVWGDFRNWQIKKEWVIQKLGSIPQGRTLLDAGAGEQQYKPYCGHLHYIAQDFGEYHPEDGKKSLCDSDNWDTSGTDIVCNITDIPLEDASVDAILCSEVLEHLKDPVLAVREFSRLLKSGGQLFLTAPFCSLTHMAPYYFSNGFSKYWYKEILGDYGFEIKEITPNGNYFKYLSQELFRLNDVVRTYCHSGLNPEEAGIMAECLRILAGLSEADSGSDELLCFGYMVEAVRK